MREWLDFEIRGRVYPAFTVKWWGWALLGGVGGGAVFYGLLIGLAILL